MAQCISPFTKKDSKHGIQHFPCGKCYDCLQRRASGWSFRLVQEGRVSHSAHFVTLTYNTENIPISKKGFMTLDKKDLQNYYKRLRKLHHKRYTKPQKKYPKDKPQRSVGNIKYYSCGEYGTKRKRPHFHIILFNAHIEDIEKAWTLNGVTLGDIHVGKVQEASIGYTLKYMTKPKTIPEHKNDDRIPEFSLMSKRLGENYITENITKWHKAKLTDRMYLPLNDGRKIAMPRYYKQKLYTDYQRKKISKHIEKLVDEETKTINYQQQLSEYTEKSRRNEKDLRINLKL